MAFSGRASESEWREPLEEQAVIAEEEELLRARQGSASALGAGQLHPEEAEAGLQDFAVAFGGGGIRSAAFCTGVLWALAEVGRLRHVTHISSVSGGSIATSGLASFLVASQRAAPPAPDEASTGADSWYLRVVADLIDRCQKNAGYLVSFNGDPWTVPSDKSSSLPRALDLVLMGMVIAGVLVAAPAVFCVFYVVPLSLLLEAYWGGVMREYFCTQELGRYRSALEMVAEGQAIISTMGVLIVGLIALTVVHRVMQFETKREPGRGYLFWRSMLHLCSRWLMLLALVLATVALVQAAEEWDYGDLRSENVCSNYLFQQAGSANMCSGSGSDVVATVEQVSHASRAPVLTGFQPRHRALSGSELSSGRHRTSGSNKPGFFWLLLLVSAVVGLIAASFLALGWSLLWHLFLVLLLPLWFIWPASFILQWRTFGPVTGQALFTPFLDATLVGEYTHTAWDWFANTALVFAILALPAFNFIHRFVHLYFKVSQQKAFFHNGSDVSMDEVDRCPWVPFLLFGVTLNEFQRPSDEEPFSAFVLTQKAMGCERTKFLRTPRWLTLSKCMALSCAAIDGLVLTQLNRWHSRVIMALLNLTQGDAMRFDVGQNWHRLGQRYPQLADRPHLFSLLDRLPEMILWTSIYVLLLFTNQNAVFAEGEDGSCTAFRVLRDTAFGMIVVFLGTMSFFPQILWCSWLLASPLVRQIHMFLMFHPALEKPPMYIYLTDGGPVEDLGIVQLLRRRRRWILSMDAGDDPQVELIDLRAAIALARSERICSFFDAEDSRRDLDVVLQRYSDGSAPFLHLGVMYTEEAGSARGASAHGTQQVGDIFHVRMRLLESPTGDLVRPEITRNEILRDPSQAISSQHATMSEAHLPTTLRASELELELSDSLGSGPEAAAAERTIARSPLAAAHQELPNGRRTEAPCQCQLPPAIPRGELGGICCSCCHSWSHGALCGAFPNTHTANQFFTPLLWANFCRLGKELAQPAISALTRAQEEDSVRQRISQGFSAQEEHSVRRRVSQVISTSEP
ncbi:unnamed protein product [Polarella glacialis]|uniref:PNPLA domain-containing protein n=1 Tax=Polarella glacialis TaxID=89957 RepID=A0A813K0F9_POLGL|nr:unnamed protein product [Polarella glacialis]